jgi:hypothetical protein
MVESEGGTLMPTWVFKAILALIVMAVIIIAVSGAFIPNGGFRVLP